MSGASVSTSARASASVNTSGGSRRMTRSAVTLIRSPAVERQLDELAAGPVELDADHQPHAADVDHARHAGERIAESGADGFADAGRALEQPLLRDRVERRERRRAGERAAAEG